MTKLMGYRSPRTSVASPAIPAVITAYAMMHSMIHAPKTIRFMGVGQACIGGNNMAATETIGTLVNVKRSMLHPPPVLTLKTSAGCYKMNVEPDLRFLKKATYYHLHHTRKTLFCV